MELVNSGQAVTLQWPGTGNHTVGHLREQWPSEANYPDSAIRPATCLFSPKAKSPELLIVSFTWSWGLKGLALSKCRETT